MTLRAKNFYLRTVAAFTAIIFCWNSLAWPLPEVAVPQAGKTFDLIPKELGTVDEYELPDASHSAPFVIHIQDLHAAPEAQEKILDILKFLHSKKKLLVAVEGAAGTLHPEYLDFFPQYPRVTNALVQDLVSESMLTGPALFAWERYESKPSLHPSLRGRKSEAISNPRLLRRAFGPPHNDNSVQFIGVETPRLYRENLKAYRDFFQDEEKNQQDLKSFQTSLESAQTKIFNPDLRKFVQEVQRRKDGKFQSGKASPDLAAYIRFLADSSRDHLGVDLRDKFEQIRFPNLTRILFLMEFESKITAHQRRVLHSEIESKKLFDEITLLETRLRQILVKKPEETKLLEILDDFKLLEKLFHLELTREEYYQVVNRVLEINPSNLHQRLATIAEIASTSSEMLSRNDADYETALRFYRLAIRRDKALLENALREAAKTENSSQEKPLIVLVTGGFHTSGVSELLKEKKIPYAVVTPALAKTKANQDQYHKLMSGKMFAKEASSASPKNNNLVWAQILTARDRYPSLNSDEDQQKIFSHATEKSGEYFRKFYPQISEPKLQELLSRPAGFFSQISRSELQSRSQITNSAIDGRIGGKRVLPSRFPRSEVRAVEQRLEVSGQKTEGWSSKIGKIIRNGSDFGLSRVFQRSQAKNYRIPSRLEKSRGERIEISLKVFIDSRSWSPVTMIVALAERAHSSTASSSGSRQAFTFVLGLTIKAFIWINEIISSSISGVIHFLSLGFSSERRKSSSKAGDKAAMNLSSSRDSRIERQTPGKASPLTSTFTSRTTRRIPFLPGLLDQIQKLFSAERVFLSAFINFAGQRTEAFSPGLMFKTTDQGNAVTGFQLIDHALNLLNVYFHGNLRHRILSSSSNQYNLSALADQNQNISSVKPSKQSSTEPSRRAASGPESRQSPILSVDRPGGARGEVRAKEQRSEVREQRIEVISQRSEGKITSSGGDFGSVRSGTSRPRQEISKPKQETRLSRFIYPFSESLGQAIQEIRIMMATIIERTALAFNEVFQMFSLTTRAANTRLTALMIPSANKFRLLDGKRVFISMLQAPQPNTGLILSQILFLEYEISRRSEVREYISDWTVSTLETKQPVLAAAFSTDGKILAAGARNNVHLTNGDLRKWSVEFRAHRNEIAKLISFQRGNRNFFATASRIGSISLWNSNGGLIRRLEQLNPEDFQPVLGLSVSKNGDWLAATDMDVMKIYDLTGMSSPKTIPITDQSRNHFVQFSPDGTSIASTYYGEIRIEDIKTGKLRANLHHEASLKKSMDTSALAFSKGDDVAAASTDGKIRIWRWKGERQPQVLDFLSPAREASHLIFSPNGKRLAASTADQIEIWKLNGKVWRHEETIYPHLDAVTEILFSPDAKRFMAAGIWHGSGRVRIWSKETPARAEVRTDGIPTTWFRIFNRLDNLNREVWKQKDLDIIDLTNQLEKKLISLFGSQLLYGIWTWNTSVREVRFGLRSGPLSFELTANPHQEIPEREIKRGYTVTMNAMLTSAAESQHAKKWGDSEPEERGETLLEIPIAEIDRSQPVIYFGSFYFDTDKEKKETIIKQEILFLPGEERNYQIYIWHNNALEKTTLEKEGGRTYAVWRTPEAEPSLSFQYVALHDAQGKDLGEISRLILKAGNSETYRNNLQFLYGPIWRDETSSFSHGSRTSVKPSVFEDLISAAPGKRIAALLGLAIEYQYVPEGQVFSRMLLTELEKLEGLPYGRIAALREIAEMSPEEAHERFKDPYDQPSAIPAVMTLVASLAPRLLERMKNWDQEFYEELKGVLQKPDLKTLFEEGEVKFYEADHLWAASDNRSFFPGVVAFSRSKDRQIIVPIYFGNEPKDEDGKVWFKILDATSLGIENSNAATYQVYDHMLGEFYKTLHSGEKLYREGWSIGIPVVPGKLDRAGFIQKGRHVQFLEMRRTQSLTTATRIGLPENLVKTQGILTDLLREMSKLEIYFFISKTGATDRRMVPVDNVYEFFSSYAGKKGEHWNEIVSEPLQLTVSSPGFKRQTLRHALRMMQEALQLTYSFPGTLKGNDPHLSFYHDKLIEETQLLKTSDQTGKWAHVEFEIASSHFEMPDHWDQPAENSLRQRIQALREALEIPFVLMLKAPSGAKDPYHIEPVGNLHQRLPYFVLKDDFLKNPHDPRFPYFSKGAQLSFGLEAPMDSARLEQVRNILVASLEGRMSAATLKRAIEVTMHQWQREDSFFSESRSEARRVPRTLAVHPVRLAPGTPLYPDRSGPGVAVQSHWNSARSEVRTEKSERLTRSNAGELLKPRRYLKNKIYGIGRITAVEGKFGGKDPQGSVEVAFLNKHGFEETKEFSTWSLFQLPEQNPEEAFFSVTRQEIEDFKNQKRQGQAAYKEEIDKKRIAQREGRQWMEAQSPTFSLYDSPFSARAGRPLAADYRKLMQGIQDRAQGEYHLGSASIVERKILFEMLGTRLIPKTNQSETTLRINLGRRKKEFAEKLKTILDETGGLSARAVSEAEEKIMSPKDKSRALSSEWLKFRDPVTGKFATEKDIKRWIQNAIPIVERILEYEVKLLKLEKQIQIHPRPLARSEVRAAESSPTKKVAFFNLRTADDSSIVLPQRMSYLPVEQRLPDYSAWRIRVGRESGNLHAFLRDVLGPRWHWNVKGETKAYFLYKSLPKKFKQFIGKRKPPTGFDMEALGLLVVNRSDIFYIPMEETVNESVVTVLDKNDRDAINEFISHHAMIQTVPQNIRIFPPVRYESVKFGLGEDPVSSPKPGSIEVVYHPRLMVNDLGKADKEIIFETSFDLTQLRPRKKITAELEGRFYQELKSRLRNTWQIRIGNRTVEMPRAKDLPAKVQDVEEILLPGNNRKTASLHFNDAVSFYLDGILMRSNVPVPKDIHAWIFWKTRIRFNDQEISVETTEGNNVLTYRTDETGEHLRVNGEPTDNSVLQNMIRQMGSAFSILAFQMARDPEQTDYLRESGKETIDDEFDQWLGRSEVREEGQPAQNGNGHAIQKKQRGRGFRTKEEALQALAERQAKGLSSDPKSLQRHLAEGGNPTLLTFIYRWNQKHPEEPIEMKLLPTRTHKYESKGEIIEALEKRRLEKGESANYRMQLRLHIEEGGDRTLYQAVLRWNHDHPEDLINLPLDPHVAHGQLGKYQTKQDGLNTLSERKKQGLGNSTSDLRQTKSDGGDWPLLVFIRHWNKKHPKDRIALENADQNFNRLSPVAVWHSQTQDFKTTDQKRTEWWRALQEEADHEAGKRLVESFIPSVNEIAQRLSGGRDSHYEADLIQNGNMIVLETIYPERKEDQWNPSRGVSMTEFVETRLKKEMRHRTLQEIRSSGRFSIDEPYRFSKGREKEWQVPSYDAQPQEVRINNLADERDKQSGLPVILFEEKHQIAREIGKWLIKKGFLKQVKQEGIQNLAVSMIGSLGVLGSAVRDKSDLNLMVVTDANESQAEALAEKLAQWIGGRYHEPQDSEPIRISVGKEGDYEQAIADGNGFISLLQKHKVGTDPIKGIASVEVIGIPDEDNSFSEDSLTRQKTRAAFHLAFQDPRLAEQAINGILVLENAKGAAERLAQKLPSDQENLFGYYEKFLAKQAANLRKLQESSIDSKARAEVHPNPTDSGTPQSSPDQARAEVRSSLPEQRAEKKLETRKLEIGAGISGLSGRVETSNGRVFSGSDRLPIKSTRSPQKSEWQGQPSFSLPPLRSLPQKSSPNKSISRVLLERQAAISGRVLGKALLPELLLIGPKSHAETTLPASPSGPLSGIYFSQNKIYSNINSELSDFSRSDGSTSSPSVLSKAEGRVERAEVHPNPTDSGTPPHSRPTGVSTEVSLAAPPGAPPSSPERARAEVRASVEEIIRKQMLSGDLKAFEKNFESYDREKAFELLNSISKIAKEISERIRKGEEELMVAANNGQKMQEIIDAAKILENFPNDKQIHGVHLSAIINLQEIFNLTPKALPRYRNLLEAIVKHASKKEQPHQAAAEIIESFEGEQHADSQQDQFQRNEALEFLTLDLDEKVFKETVIKNHFLTALHHFIWEHSDFEDAKNLARELGNLSLISSLLGEPLSKRQAAFYKRALLSSDRTQQKIALGFFETFPDLEKMDWKEEVVGKLKEIVMDESEDSEFRKYAFEALTNNILLIEPAFLAPYFKEPRSQRFRIISSDKKGARILFSVLQKKFGSPLKDPPLFKKSSESIILSGEFTTGLRNAAMLIRFVRQAYGREISFDESRGLLKEMKKKQDRSRRSEIRSESLDSTWELREDANKGKLAELGKQFAPMIESLWKRSEVRHRLATDGFLNLSKLIEIPKAEAAEPAIVAALLIRAEQSQTGTPALDKHLQVWQSRMGISSVAKENEVVILLEGAAFKLGLLAAIDGISPAAPKIGVVAPKAYHSLVEEVRSGLRTGQELIEGEKLPEILNQIAQMKQKPSRLTIWASKEDSFLTAAFIKRFLKDPNLNVEVKTVTQRDLDRANASHPGFAERIKNFLAAVKSLSISA